MREQSPQTLSETDRRLVAVWAADCVEHVVNRLGASRDEAIAELITRTRAYARGEMGTAEGIRRRFTGGAANAMHNAALAAAVHAAGQAAAIPHMGAHAMGAAAYAAQAIGLANPDKPKAIEDEIQWQLGHMSAEVHRALQSLPPVGKNPAGPLGPGLLASGQLGEIIHTLQVGLESNIQSHISL